MSSLLPRTCSVATAALFCALAAVARPQAAQPDAHVRAVVVGISRYAKLPGGQQLQFAEKDAAAFAELLRSLGVRADQIRLLVGAEATVASMKSAIGNWLAQSADSDTAIIYFSGHGIVEHKFDEAYLLGYDSDPRDPYGSALSISDLEQALVKRVRTGSVFVMADAMRRDFFDPEVDAAASASFTKAFAHLSSARAGAEALLANGPGEFSREGQRWGGHGAFTKHLVDVFSTRIGRDGHLSADDLFDGLSALLVQDTAGKQHPWRSTQSVSRVLLPARRQGAIATETRKSEQPSGEATARSNNPPAPRKEIEQPVVASRTAPDLQKDGQTEAQKKSGAPTSKPDNQPVGVTPAPRAQPGGPTSVTRTEASSAPSNAATPTVSPESKPVARSEPKAEARAPVSPPSAKVSESPKPPPVNRPAPPSTTAVNAPAASPARTVASSPPANSPAEVGTPPRPAITPPSVGAVSTDPRAPSNPAAVGSTLPEHTTTIGAAPSPLIVQLEAAIASNNLVEPRGSSAWDLYQRLTADPASAAEQSRLKPLLGDALLKMGRTAVTADIRSDNITDKTDEIKRAGQILARARSLGVGGDIAALEKLTAAEALIALQFYDEAELTLNQLRNLKLAGVENALGLVAQGKLDTFSAERAFKRAIELDPKLSAAHYNLAMLYRSSQNDSAITEFEQAASLDPTNPALLESLGDEYFTHQQWRQAAGAFQQALKLKPSDETLHTKLGHALFSQGLTEEANREYKRASELRRKP